MFLKEINRALVVFLFSFNAVAGDFMFYFNPDLTARMGDKDVKITKNGLKTIIEKKELKKQLDEFLGFDSVKLYDSSSSQNITYYDYSNLVNVSKIIKSQKLIKNKTFGCNGIQDETLFFEQNLALMENQFIVTSENFKKGIKNTRILKIFLNDLGVNVEGTPEIFKNEAEQEINEVAEFVKVKRSLEKGSVTENEAKTAIKYLNKINSHLDGVEKYISQDQAIKINNFVKLTENEKIKILTGENDGYHAAALAAGLVVAGYLAYRATKSIVGEICSDRKKNGDLDGPILPRDFPVIKDPKLDPQRPNRGV